MRYLSDIIVLFKSVFRYASREYHIRNVLDGIILPKKHKTEIAVMNKEQQLRLEKYLDKHPSVTSVGISISMYMGLRIGEVCALQLRNIDLEKRVLTVSKTIQRVQCRAGSKHTKLIITEPKSESSKRTIPIPDCLLPLLRQFKDNGEVYVVHGTSKPVRGNHTELTDLIYNLIDNAINYNRENGNIDITIEDNRFIIADTGIGMPKESIPRIFERFYRVDKSRSRAKGGTGLGL